MKKKTIWDDRKAKISMEEQNPKANFENLQFNLSKNQEESGLPELGRNCC